MVCLYFCMQRYKQQQERMKSKPYRSYSWVISLSASYFQTWYPALPRILLVCSVVFSQNDLRGNGEQSPFMSFFNEFDYSSTSILGKHPRNERVISAEELVTMSKNNLRGITPGIRPIWTIYFLTLHPLLTIAYNKTLERRYRKMVPFVSFKLMELSLQLAKTK